MARYRVQGPDGKIHVFEGPDGASPADIEAFAAQTFGKPAVAPATPQDDAQPKASAQTLAVRKAVEERENRVGRNLAMGAFKGVADVGDTVLNAGAGAYEAVRNAVTAPTLSELVTGRQPSAVKQWNDGRKQSTDNLFNTHAAPDTLAFKGGRLASNVAVTAPVGGVLGAGAKAAGATRLGNALASGGFTTGGGAATTLGGKAADMGLRVLGGAGTGAASAALIDPSDAGAGAVVGGALPPALKVAGAAGKFVGGGAKSLLQPFYESGRQAIVGRALASAAGDDAADVALRLEQASQPFVGPSQGVQRVTMGELVPGSVPTVGQVAANPGVAALERAASAASPEVTNALSSQMAGQNAARVNVLQDLAGTGGARDFAVAARDGTAEQLYGAARRNGINPAALTPEAQANMAAFAQRIPDEVLGEARRLAKINGEPLTDASSIQGMHWVKMAIDGLIGQADRAGNNTLKRAYTGLQKDLLTGMDKLSPDYAAARQVYSEMSRPINQMDVAGEIAKKSIDPLSGNLRPAAFARNLSDETAARATGYSGATLENTLDPAQLNQLNMVLADAQRANAAQTAGRGAGSDTVQKLAYTNMLDRAGVPTFVRNLGPGQVVGNVLARGADAVYARQNRELATLLAESMLDPALAARFMRQADAPPNVLLRGLANPTAQRIAHRTVPVLAADQ